MATRPLDIRFSHFETNKVAVIAFAKKGERVWWPCKFYIPACVNANYVRSLVEFMERKIYNADAW